MYLIHAPIDMREFNRWAGERGLLRRGSFDPDFALHILLAAMFGKRALQPFRLFWSERRRAASLYAYADVDRGELLKVAAAVAPPDCLAPLNPIGLRSKPMPTLFDSGRRLGFDLRVRPVRRLRHDLHDTQNGRVIAQGREVDAFRLAILQRFPDGWRAHRAHANQNGMRREAVYTAWLAERLEGAATLEECRLSSFIRSRTVRGDGPGPEGPDATLQGVFSVDRPEVLSRRLRGGVGRHRAYGYGMLLLRPPKRI
ncbi:MAG: type I-E CRISPR-associated protein Cas6/Cse3/CasE [Spirochaetaceae bacterium]|nr:type I-E CRISPR-associated protein Cas6/Cse3/CasE [Spirochaetaceae bacterium]